MTDDRKRPEADDGEDYRRHQERLQTPEALEWIASVDEAMRVWDIPYEDAAEVIDGLVREHTRNGQTFWRRSQMPEWQRAMETVAWQLADLIPVHALTAAAIERLRAAIAAYDAERQGGSDAENN